MTFLERICVEFNKNKQPYALVGGHAVALHGAVRGTVDVDFVVEWSKKTLTKTESTLNSMGLISRLPIDANDVFTFREEYIEKRNLIAWNFYNPENLMEQVDIIINYDFKENTVKNIKIGTTVIPLLNIDELIKMKTESGREQDLSDIDALQQIKLNEPPIQ